MSNVIRGPRRGEPERERWRERNTAKYKSGGFVYKACDSKRARRERLLRTSPRLAIWRAAHAQTHYAPQHQQLFASLRERESRLFISRSESLSHRIPRRAPALAIVDKSTLFSDPSGHHLTSIAASDVSPLKRRGYVETAHLLISTTTGPPVGSLSPSFVSILLFEASS